MKTSSRTSSSSSKSKIRNQSKSKPRNFDTFSENISNLQDYDYKIDNKNHTRTKRSKKRLSSKSRNSENNVVILRNTHIDESKSPSDGVKVRVEKINVTEMNTSTKNSQDESSNNFIRQAIGRCLFCRNE